MLGVTHALREPPSTFTEADCGSRIIFISCVLHPSIHWTAWGTAGNMVGQSLGRCSGELMKCEEDG